MHLRERFAVAAGASAALVLDGAWGTQLAARGLPPGACPDAWNRARPPAGTAVAAAYVAAGARAVLTNTFGANRLVLAKHGLHTQVAAINRAGVALTRQALPAGGLVIASLGPSGQVLAAGETTAAELAAVFREQAEALAAGGADVVVVETMSDPEEAAIAVAAVKAAGLPAIASFAFGCGKDGDRTMNGARPETCVQAALAAGADLVGANCGLTPGRMLPVIKRLAAAAGGTVWAKANAGQPELIDNKTVWRIAPAAFAAEAAALAAAGACAVGGCCGSDPACIAALAGALAPHVAKAHA
jgi:methionine synthase I (cobalamin-dependent)